MKDVTGSPASSTRARRSLGDGRQLDVVKLFWNADELTDRLRAIGWSFDIRLVADVFMYGVGAPA